jgi:rhodanese-related sulfurtransferase
MRRRANGFYAEPYSGTTRPLNYEPCESLSMPTPSADSPIEIDCRQVNEKLTATKQTDSAEFVLLDCREEDEYALVRIESSRLLPMSEIATRVEELAEHRDAEIIVYCHHGMRSLQVATWLRQQGFAHATSMIGGVDRWAIEIDPSLARY